MCHPAWYATLQGGSGHGVVVVGVGWGGGGEWDGGGGCVGLFRERHRLFAKFYVHNR